MIDDASVDHVPVHTGGSGKAALRAFYRDVFIPSWPADLKQTPINRVIGHDQIVDELRLEFTHERPMDWLLPGVPPTGKKIDVTMVVIVQFREGKDRLRTNLLGPGDRPEAGRLAQAPELFVRNRIKSSAPPSEVRP